MLTIAGVFLWQNQFNPPKLLTIATFRQNLTQPQYGWNDVAASQLYDWLIRPAQQYLTFQTKQLVFVMDGALQNIPVSALFDRSRQEYLIGCLNSLVSKFF